MDSDLTFKYNRRRRRRFNRNEVGAVVFALRTYRRWNSRRSLDTLRSILGRLFGLNPRNSRILFLVHEMEQVQQLIAGSFSSFYEEQIEDILDMSRIAYNEEGNDDDYEDEYNSYQSS